MNFEEIKELVKLNLSEKRFNHTIAVTKLASELAFKYGTNIDDAYLSAILHDITKEQEYDVQLQTIKKSDIIISDMFEDNTNLYHALTAYLYARDVLKITNTDVLNAIRYHTTGRKNMSILEKIIYVADACSYDRTYKQAQELRELSFQDIDECIVQIIEFTVIEVVKKRNFLAIDTIDFYNTMLKNGGKQNEKENQ